jgi:hypothetical protein
VRSIDVGCAQINLMYRLRFLGTGFRSGIQRRLCCPLPEGTMEHNGWRNLDDGSGRLSLRNAGAR